MSRSNIIDLTVHLHHETYLNDPERGALLVSDDGEDDSAVWVPKRLVEYEQVKGAIYTISLPEYIAQEKGLI